MNIHVYVTFYITGIILFYHHTLLIQTINYVPITNTPNND